ncbi:MAG: hypothetical protein JXR83_14940 [Deltaproteobacteria bacterium]|nr:hypothetical protein [Deltaproteobacteria bacterium]
MTGASLLLAALAAAAGIEVVADGPIAPVHGAPLISSDVYQVTLGALLETQIDTAAGAGFAVPRARLRTEALLDVAIPVGMRVELEASPWADRASNLDGPGSLRDAYLLLGVGNRKLINLGQVTIGQQLVPSSAASLQPPERWRLAHRPLLEQRMLPGLDVGLLYHIDYGSYGWPLRLWIGSFGGAGPNRVGGELRPLYAARAEGDLPLARPGRGRARIGAAVVGQPSRADLPAVVTVDGSVRLRRLELEASCTLAPGGTAPSLARGALRAEGGVELLADFLELRLRHEALNLATGRLQQRLTAGVVLTYLDDAFQMLLDYVLPWSTGGEPDEPAMALTLRLWW